MLRRDGSVARPSCLWGLGQVSFSTMFGKNNALIRYTQLVQCGFRLGGGSRIRLYKEDPKQQMVSIRGGEREDIP